jgi:hypothetical protein
MVKVSKRNNKRGDQVVNESSLIDHDTLMASSSTSNTNSGGDVVEEVEIGDNNENQPVTHESNVWKYATKVNSEKARCNVCQMGNYTNKI